ncbi:uncharacterized protein LOC113777120 [Coffea eugenioides]|uniref:uncharacterized protein LOC113777120 n=1 Tax=Coffea eugenioides TaxID=49369 RepID=UPI000F6139A1|nr:uncharacterized protein LOC113777120 [Coffea eugenioides]
MSTSGVAASILPRGRTAHSRFKILLNDDEAKTCNISKLNSIAQLIKDAKLIIWDEAMMAKRKAIERFDQLLQDIMSNKQVFGGKTVIFGGDFRQTLPGMKSVILVSTTLESSGHIQNEDFLHTLMPKGLSPHQLKLKKNCLVMLLRNINPIEGLSNGTRLICKEFGNNVIQAEIAFWLKFEIHLFDGTTIITALISDKHASTVVNMPADEVILIEQQFNL